ncbi:hypothetical protein [Pilimelia terevasa]|uniref:hypothetical protein n=1 Tax=Pilimelia terevasa TaxID=53372 RepID=UPI00166429DE|nr:hypothetical protein [Pilimelia terevasa]
MSDMVRCIDPVAGRPALADDLVEAVFASDLATGAAVTQDRYAAAVRRALQVHGGVGGCLAVMATAYGEHPECAVPRSAWARALVDRFYG